MAWLHAQHGADMWQECDSCIVGERIVCVPSTESEISDPLRRHDVPMREERGKAEPSSAR